MKLKQKKAELQKLKSREVDNSPVEQEMLTAIKTILTSHFWNPRSGSIRADDLQYMLQEPTMVCCTAPPGDARGGCCVSSSGPRECRKFGMGGSGPDFWLFWAKIEPPLLPLSGARGGGCAFLFCGEGGG